MNKGAIVLAGVLGVALVAGFVVLEALGRDAGAFSTFALVLLPTVAGLYAANESRQAKKSVDSATDSIETVREQTNGALTGPLADLVTEVKAIKAWMVDHETVTVSVLAELEGLRQGRHAASASGRAGSDPQ